MNMLLKNHPFVCALCDPSPQILYHKKGMWKFPSLGKIPQRRSDVLILGRKVEIGSWEVTVGIGPNWWQSKKWEKVEGASMTTFLSLYDFVYLFNSEAMLIIQVILSYVQHVEKK